MADVARQLTPEDVSAVFSRWPRSPCPATASWRASLLARMPAPAAVEPPEAAIRNALRPVPSDGRPKHQRRRHRGPEPARNPLPSAEPSPPRLRRRIPTRVAPYAPPHRRAARRLRAGGIETPFGGAQLQPHARQGAGAGRRLSSGAPCTTVQQGRAAGPRLPYTSYTQVTREDLDVICLPAKPAAGGQAINSRARAAFSIQHLCGIGGMAALFCTRSAQPAPPAPQTATANDNRGAYLVNGLGHCTARHTPQCTGATSDARASPAG